MFLSGFTFFIALFALLILFRCSHRLNLLKDSVNKNWSLLDQQLQRRYDRLPHLVEELANVVKSRRLTLKSILQTGGQAEQFMKILRQVGGPLCTDMSPLLDAEARLVRLIEELLKFSQTLPSHQRSALHQTLVEFSQLQNRILFARQKFNESVVKYNRQQQTRSAKWVVGFGQHASVALYQIASI